MGRATTEARPISNHPAFTVLHRATSLADLEDRRRMVVRIEGHQIALFRTRDGVRAVANQCPHEGYPLAEGSLSDDCVLTCNWHNWKFDLDSGETLVGGDRVRIYPVEIRDGEVFVDLTEPPACEQIDRSWSALEEAFRDHDYSRLAREIGRLLRNDVSTTEITARAFDWAHDRLEFGMTHAQAAAADWLALHDAEVTSGHEDTAIVTILEAVGHLSWDTLREPAYPYPEGTRTWDADELVDAIEREDEPAAIAIVRGFLTDRHPCEELEHALARAALAHYQDYGHSAIYVYKTGQLVERFGPTPWLLFPLVRSLIYASREDQIPEFRGYAPARKLWSEGPAVPTEDGMKERPEPRIDPAGFRGISVNKALEHCLTVDVTDPRSRLALFDALLDASAWTMLHFDERWMHGTDQPISKNAAWLDFTHTLTFANAVHRLATRYPDLWPAGLLQMACFVGRLRPFLDTELDASRWRVDDADGFLRDTRSHLFDHGSAEYIISAHWVKVWAAVDEEVRSRDDAPWAMPVLAATRRFFEASHKRKHALRTVRQALRFVKSE
ncbi:MAG: Rieske 2Fe-2S domain-containing protein [Candidatus Eisenbacteria bacterium]